MRKSIEKKRKQGGKEKVERKRESREREHKKEKLDQPVIPEAEMFSSSSSSTRQSLLSPLSHSFSPKLHVDDVWRRGKKKKRK